MGKMTQKPFHLVQDRPKSGWPYDKAAVTYVNGLVHDPDNEELMDGVSRARDGLSKAE